MLSPSATNGKPRPAHSERCSRQDAASCCDNCWQLWHSPPHPQTKSKAKGKSASTRKSAARIPTDDKPPTPQTPLVIARPASAYVAKPVDWLWPGRIPCGALTILDGDPGLGKSTVTLDLAARVSRGYAMPPGGGPSDILPANVVILSAEDDPARVIRPRLEAAGADLDRVQIVEAISTGGDGDHLPILPYDLHALEQFVLQHRARLLTLDPIMAFLGNGIDAHKDQSIRLALREFAKLAERTQCALLVIRHLNKLMGGAALYRGGGSIGIIGAARSGLLLAKHPDNPDSRVIASTKSNLGPPPRSIVFSLHSAGAVAVAEWGEEISMSADELLSAGGLARQSKTDESAAAIIELLTAGPMKSVELDAALKERGHSTSGIQRGRKAAGVKASKSSYDGDWFVSLPDQGTQGIQGKES